MIVTRWMESLVRTLWPGRCPATGELLRPNEPGPFVASVDADLMAAGWLGRELVPETLDATFSCLRYGPALSRALQAWKYHHRQAVGRQLVVRALERGRVGDRFWPQFVTEEVWITPVPLHPRRERWRGFSPPAATAAALAAAGGRWRFATAWPTGVGQAPTRPARAEVAGRRRAAESERERPARGGPGRIRTVEILRRSRNTPTQTRRSRSERAANVDGAFESRCTVPGGVTVILVDDVSTTGATMAACAATLRRAGARRIVGFVLAHSPGPERDVADRKIGDQSCARPTRNHLVGQGVSAGLAHRPKAGPHTASGLPSHSRDIADSRQRPISPVSHPGERDRTLRFRRPLLRLNEPTTDGSH